jgi:hypothetical protein|tara:strand:+ start:2245 stop:2865 length:621 start_codon:yes stop_codon:yes gene_type:complete
MDNLDEVLKYRNAAIFDLPEDIMQDLKERCFKAKQDQASYNDRLAGHIKEQYKIEEASLEFIKYLMLCCKDETIFKQLPSYILSESKPVYLDTMWVNFQKKHEFNPPHTHTGVLSFVIFVQIPYDLKEEEKCFKIKLSEDNSNQTSKFGFLNTDYQGRIKLHTLDVDKTFEGKILLFNSKQMHTVFPFYTSDDYRITVSGNLKIKT